MVGIAGCSGGTTDATPTPEPTATPAPTDSPTATATATATATPTPEPTPTATPEPTLESVDFPNGLSMEGATTALVRVHEGHIAGQTVHLATQREFKGAYSGPTVRTNSTVGTDAAVVVRDDGYQTTERFVNESGGYIRTQSNGETTYKTDSYGFYRTGLTGTDQYELFIGAATFTPTEAFELNDETVIEAEASGLSDSAAVEERYSFVDSIDAFEGQLLVTEDGLVRQFSYNITYTADGETASDVVTTRVTNVTSDPVQTPAWVSTAASNAVSVDLRVVGDGTAIAIENTGEVSVDAGTTMLVFPHDSQNQFQTTLDSAIEPGQTSYLYLEGANLKSGNTVPENASTAFANGAFVDARASSGGSVFSGSAN